jgi:hypothetical protein
MSLDEGVKPFLNLNTFPFAKDSTIYTHNAKGYVSCADQAGGLFHNDFRAENACEETRNPVSFCDMGSTTARLQI